jgi:hypothetical protein
MIGGPAGPGEGGMQQTHCPLLQCGQSVFPAIAKAQSKPIAAAPVRNGK